MGEAWELSPHAYLSCTYDQWDDRTENNVLSSGKIQCRTLALTTTACHLSVTSRVPKSEQTTVNSVSTGQPGPGISNSALFAQQGSELGTQILLQPQGGDVSWKPWGPQPYDQDNNFIRMRTIGFCEWAKPLSTVTLKWRDLVRGDRYWVLAGCS